MKSIRRAASTEYAAPRHAAVSRGPGGSRLATCAILAAAGLALSCGASGAYLEGSGSCVAVAATDTTSSDDLCLMQSYAGSTTTSLEDSSTANINDGSLYSLAASQYEVRLSQGNIGLRLTSSALALDNTAAVSEASASAKFSDNINVVGASGATADVRYVYTLDASYLGETEIMNVGAVSDVSFKSTFSITTAPDDCAYLSTSSVGNCNRWDGGVYSYSGVIRVQSGDTLHVEAAMYAHVYDVVTTLDKQYVPPMRGKATGVVDALHSLTLELTSLTPGIDLVSDSGYDYSQTSPVPEPAAATSLLVGLGALAIVHRRRSSSVHAATRRPS